MTNQTDRTYQALSEVRERLPYLREALAPGTPRRWNQLAPTAEQLNRMNQQARTDRADRDATIALGLKVLGASPAPLNLKVLDTEQDVRAAVAELERAICDRLGLTPLAGKGPTASIARIVGLLDRIARDVELAEHVQAEAVRLARRIARALGDAEPVHRINGRCPYCDARSLRAFPEREVVVCANRACVCLEKGCGCLEGVRHRWTFEAWPWLAEEIAAMEAAS